MYYSVKTNPCPGLLKILCSIGLNFHVCSHEELKALEKAGIGKERIMLYNPSFSQDDFLKLGKKGYPLFTIDSPSQYHELEKSGIEARILLRIRGFTKPRGSPFHPAGLGMSTSESEKLILGNLKNRNQISIIGLHMHLASQNNDLYSWKRNIGDFADFFSMLEKKGFKPLVADIGGGFPVDYGRRTLSIKKIADALKPSLEKIRSLGAGLFIEPGRIIAAPAGFLSTSVALCNGSTVMVNASVYSSAIDTLLGIELPIMAPIAAKSGKKYMIRGKSPCSLDVFSHARLINPKKGDRIIFRNAGAYTYSSDFMGYKKPKIIFIK